MSLPAHAAAEVSAPSAYLDPALPDTGQLQAAAAAASAAQPGSFRLFSHGRPGQLFIQGQWLGAPAIAAWLPQNGLPQGTKQLHIYGCEFAQGELGQQAVTTLEQALGLKVAASTNVTGKDGDWVLEVGMSQPPLQLRGYAHNLPCTGPAGDCDGDGVPDATDEDNDNDGMPDVLECAV